MDTLAQCQPVSLQLVDITTLNKIDALKVLSIRNEPGVRNNMYTNHVISEAEHFAWIERLKHSTDTKFFAVVKDHEIVGGASISGINHLHKRADWAFYLSESVQGKGVGSALETMFVTMAFDDFAIEKLNCEVISFNDKVIKLHRKFGFAIEGARRNHVIRDGGSFDAILLGITKGEWRALMQATPAQAVRQ